ncbi:MAG: MFS transporter [Candidatus Eremiobacteraeota bacterium]|nr:MFS transporter [Candidatus Eremiobacteraeota bacterium]
MNMALASASTPAAVPADKADRSGLFLLTAAHLVNDLNQGVLPAMIPWLVMHRGLSLTLAATLTLAANLFGSIVQPLFGYLSDKRSTAWVIPVAVLCATGGTALIGIAPTLPLMLAGAVISGVGVAAFHPESSRFSNYFAGRKRASGMSTFTVGGYLGFALGPILAAPLILAFGLPGVAFLLIPAATVAVLLFRELPRFNEVRRTAHRAHRERSGKDDWRGFSLMAFVVALRSTTFLAAVTFTPVFIMRVSGVHAVFGSFSLFALLLGGAIGTMQGGRLADRVDRRRVITLSLALTAVLGSLLAICGTHFPAYALMTVLALGFGISLGLSAGVLVVLGQEYLPKHIGVASGVTLGLANTVGGLAAPAFGKIGDDVGLVMVYVAIAAFAVLAFGGTFLMPKPQGVQQA